MSFTFLPGTLPRGLNPTTVRFYTWAATTRAGELVASDYAPDTGWISYDTP